MLARTDRPSDARIVPLKPGRSGPALFMVPGFGGSVGRLTALATLLATPMPVFALEGRGIDGAAPPDTSVADMAQHYLDRISTLPVTGPYFLLGHSFGGTVALEMARRLLAAGAPVACLIMLDANYGQRHWPRRYYLRVMARRLLGRPRRFRATPRRYKSLYLSYLLQKLTRQRAGAAATGAAAMMAAHQFALDRYDPGFYPEKLIFFRASRQDFPAEPEALWRRRVRLLDIHAATGGHLSMLDPPNVASLAAAISACLTTASAAAAHAPV